MAYNSNSWWRWWLITWVDRLWPRRYCWGNLCNWAAYGHETRLRDWRVGTLCCRKEARREGSCYCGQFIGPLMVIDKQRMRQERAIHKMLGIPMWWEEPKE